jgi:tRNA-dihydrouridine synthase A
MLKSARIQEDETVNTLKPHISIAPMMDWTDRHCRYFHRLLSSNVRLYTEMVTTGALIHGDKDRHLRFNEQEHYVALQLGGSEPADLALAARMGEDYGYDEINLNCGCPSERVQKGAFGACLMAEPQTVADCVAAMKNAVTIPVTVKCRIGIDDCDEYEFVKTFVKDVASAGCEMFVIHARKAWLKGLSPKENREKPPIRYDIAARLKNDFPNLEIILNGEIKTTDHIREHLSPAYQLGDVQSATAKDYESNMDGIMIGREAYQNPSILLDIEREIFGNHNTLSKQQVIEMMIPYIEEQNAKYGTPMKSITRHMIPLYQGERGSRAWRRILSTEAHLEGATPQILRDALSEIAA